MKGSRLYMMILGVFLVLVFLFEYMAPHQFVWKATYDKNDREPFGSSVFDDVVSSSIVDYTVSDKTFYQIFHEDSTALPRAFLLMEESLSFSDIDIEFMYKLVHLGNQVMIGCDYFAQKFKDTLCFNIEYGGSMLTIDKSIKERGKRDSIFFGKDPGNPDFIYEIYPQMHPINLIDSSFTKHSPMICDSSEILVWNKKGKPLVIRAFIGKGEIFLVSTPLMFTNYNILDGNNASYVFRLLSTMKDKPLIRIEAYGSHSDKPQTPLRYMLLEPPLRWATYSSIILLILFMIFTAKRRQRVIPVVESPPNRTLEFMQLISNLYYQNHDNFEILKMKYLYFCSEVKGLIGIDLQDGITDESDCLRLAEKSGTDAEEISLLLKDIQRCILYSYTDDAQLKKDIDRMNGMLGEIRN